jgi:hypothetical protein
MKLDKKLLKKIIKESLEEAKYGHLESIPGEGRKAELGDIAPEEWEQAFAKGPDPVPEQDIAAYFKQVGDELNDRIKQLSAMPKFKPVVKTPEETAKAVEELTRASEEAKSIVKALEDIKNKLK